MEKFNLRVIKFSRYIIIAIGLIYAVSYIITSILRIIYPYAILNVEGASYQVLYALQYHYPLYGAPDINNISIVYTPIYYITSYLISFISGYGYQSLRLCSFLSSLGIFYMIFIFIKKETDDNYSALIAVLFFILINPISGSWLNLAKPDSLMLLVLLISFYIIRFKENYASYMLAGILIALSYFLKQQALSISIILLVYLLIIKTRKALVMFVSSAIIIIAGHYILDALTENWFTYYTFTLPYNITYNTIVLEKLINYILKDNIIYFPIIFAIIIFNLLFTINKDKSRQSLFYIILYISVTIGILPTRIIYGGNLNPLMPCYAIMTIMFGISASNIIQMSKETNPRINVTLSLLYIAIILQFTMNSYDPLAAVPNKQQYAENAATVNAIKSYEGEVFVQNFGQLADMAGKHSTPHFGTVDDILVGDRGKVREDLVNNFKAAFSNKYYAAVFLEHVWLNYDYNNEIRLELERNYTETGTDPSHRFIIYEPKQR